MRGRNNFLRLKSHFIKTSTKIFELGLDANTLSVFFYFLSVREDFNPSVRWTANQLGLAPNTVSKAVGQLLSANVIKMIAPPAKGAVTIYEFNPPTSWKSI